MPQDLSSMPYAELVEELIGAAGGTGSGIFPDAVQLAARERLSKLRAELLQRLERGWQLGIAAGAATVHGPISNF